MMRRQACTFLKNWRYARTGWRQSAARARWKRIGMCSSATASRISGDGTPCRFKPLSANTRTSRVSSSRIRPASVLASCLANPMNLPSKRYMDHLLRAGLTAKASSSLEAITPSTEAVRIIGSIRPARPHRKGIRRT